MEVYLRPHGNTLKSTMVATGWPVVLASGAQGDELGEEGEVENSTKRPKHTRRRKDRR